MSDKRLTNAEQVFFDTLFECVPDDGMRAAVLNPLADAMKATRDTWRIFKRSRERGG
jgi:hypothetical protein